MKTFNLLIIIKSSLLNKINFFKKLIHHTSTYLTRLINRMNMDQIEGDMQEDEQVDEEYLIRQNPAMVPDQYQYEPLENIDVEDVGANVDSVRMNLYEESSDDSDYTYDSNTADCNRGRYSFQPLRLIKCLYKTRYNSLAYPIARSGHRITASDSHLYSLGGYNPNRRQNATNRGSCKLFQELWAYNFATNRWKLLQNANNPNMPKELASNALVMYNNVLISHGGTGYPFGETCSNDCYVYTTGDDPRVVLMKTGGDLPSAQYGPAIVIHKDYLYTIGGTTGFDYSCDVYRLNLLTKVWENVYICRPEMRDDPEGRYRHEVVYDGSHIYILGGGTEHTVYDMQCLPAFNLETNHWDYFETLPDRTLITSEDPGYPRARKCLSCVQHTLPNGDIEAFIAGGLQADFTTYFNDIWKLNLRTKQWCKIRNASLPSPLYFHSAAHSGNGCMYIFGGIQYSEKDICRSNDLFKMWMTIPKLSDICWEAFNYYNTNIMHVNRDSLLRAGIPKRYVNLLPPMQTKRRILDESLLHRASYKKKYTHTD